MKTFMKDWGLFILILLLAILSRIFLWSPVTVDGHSMDPTLANKQRLILLKKTKIERFDIVVAQEGSGKSKIDIVKRVIGLPGDTITYKNDKLYINGKYYSEPYLNSYKKKFAKDKLQKTYSYDSFFQELAQNSSAFTTDSQGNADFTITVKKGQYLLLGDDRIISKDSRAVGTFSRSKILGKVVFRFWPLSKIGRVEK